MDATDAFAGTQEVLSQSEVENLLAQVAEQDSKATVVQSDGAVKSQPKDSIQPYDFRTPVFLTPTELRRLRILHEQFISSLAARLSIYMRLEFGLQMSKLQTITFQKFTEGLANPTHLTLFRVEPMRGICVIELAPQLGLTLVDRLMGGPGHSVNLTRDLSEIEVALLDQVIQIIISEWCSQWAEFQDLRQSILGHETNGQFLHTCETDAVTLVLAMEARIGDCTEQIQIGIPYNTIEPLIRKLSLKLRPDDNDLPPDQRPKSSWNPAFSDVSIPVTAEWPALELSVSELSQLKVGDVLHVDPENFNQVQIRLAHLTKFVGRLGAQGSRRAVEITRVVKPATAPNTPKP